jgi:hypothetical protein
MRFSYRMVPEVYQLFGRRWHAVSSSPMPLWRLAPIASRAPGGWWRGVGFGRAAVVA